MCWCLIACSHIGHFVFIRTLLPILKKTASEPNSDVRIVSVSSPSVAREHRAYPVQVSTDGYDAVRHPITLKTKEDFNLEYKDATFPWPSLMRYCTVLLRAASSPG